MNKYKISYKFDGYGDVIIKAKDKEEAEDLFDELDFDRSEEWNENTEILEGGIIKLDD